MRAAKAALFVLLFLVFQPIALSESPYAVDEATLAVFTDGVVQVTVTIKVNEAEAFITLPLLSPQAHMFNLIVLDENGAPLDYDFGERNITIYSLGASSILLEYDTDALTRKEAGVWTLTLDVPFELTVLFPENSMLIYMNAPPSLISSDEGRLKLVLYPGYWEISYEILRPQTTTQTKASVEFIPMSSNYILAVGIITVLAVGLMIALILTKRRRRFGELKAEEAEIVRFLEENNGRALEAELREAFPNIPRTTMWRLVKRLEKKGVLRVRKVGLQNVVELIR
ncbi:MAG: hypothetical protein QXO01_03535 [Nitrososphaerota archaeon]